MLHIININVISQNMEEWGNKRSNEYYEANIPPHVVRPKEGDAVRIVERFIRDKYEHKRYVAGSIPPKSFTPSETASLDDAKKVVVVSVPEFESKKKLPPAVPTAPVNVPTSTPAPRVTVTAPVQLAVAPVVAAPVVDLLDFNTPVQVSPAVVDNSSHEFYSEFTSAPPPPPVHEVGNNPVAFF